MVQVGKCFDLSSVCKQAEPDGKPNGKCRFPHRANQHIHFFSKTSPESEYAKKRQNFVATLTMKQQRIHFAKKLQEVLLDKTKLDHNGELPTEFDCKDNEEALFKVRTSILLH